METKQEINKKVHDCLQRKQENKQKISVSAPNVLVTKAPKSTSCSGLPVDQSNSLRIGSSRQDAQTPLPPAHRKRTCFSLRSETENICCEGGEITVLASCKAGLNMTRTTQNRHLFGFLPRPFCSPCLPRALCSNILPTAGYLWQGSSEWAARGLIPEASHSVPVDSSHLTITENITGHK